MYVYGHLPHRLLDFKTDTQHFSVISTISGAHHNPQLPVASNLGECPLATPVPQSLG